jgi:hypothetical protein
VQRQHNWPPCPAEIRRRGCTSPTLWKRTNDPAAPGHGDQQAKAGLLAALDHFKLDSIKAQAKEHWRDVVLRGGPWTDAEREGILDYCQSDVDALYKLLEVMPIQNWGQSLIRGRYMAADAWMRHRGIPVDRSLCAALAAHWGELRLELIDDLNTLPVLRRRQPAAEVAEGLAGAARHSLLAGHTHGTACDRCRELARDGAALPGGRRVLLRQDHAKPAEEFRAQRRPRELRTVFGWTMRVLPHAKPGTLANFPMQANGAEMLRLACCYAVDRDLPIVAPIHDAVLVEGPASDIDDIAHEMQHCMVEVSRVVLGGPAVRVDMSKPLTFPHRYVDGRDGSVELWARTLRLLDQLKQKGKIA